MLGFDNGHFSEYGTFSVTDWVARTPPHVVPQNFGLSAECVRAAPKELYIGPGKIAGETCRSRTAPNLTRRRPAQVPAEPDARAGVTGRVASHRDLGRVSHLRALTAVLHHRDPGALRKMHWHPNADEWQYYVAGRARLTVFGSSGRARTEDVSTGDATYIPRGYGHHIENVGTDEVQIIAGFNSGIYQEVGLTAWMHNVPPALLADNLGLDEGQARQIAHAAVPIAARS